MNPRRERDLRKCPLFSDDDVSHWENRDNWPELSEDESLLSGVVGQEDDILAVSAWIRSDLERLGYFAMYYRDRARDLVRLSLKSGLGAENYAYVVGYLYRHAVELYMKSIIAGGAPFKALSIKDQGDALLGHRLSDLWDQVKPLVVDLYDESEIRLVESKLNELHTLDEGSDGFRYPFKIARKTGERESLVGGLGRASFDNFVWVLDALSSWFATAEDTQAKHGATKTLDTL